MSTTAKLEDNDVPSYDDFKSYLDKLTEKERKRKSAEIENLQQIENQLSNLKLSPRVKSKSKEKIK